MVPRCSTVLPQDFIMPDETNIPTDSTSLRLAAANGLIRRRRTIKPDKMSDKPIEKLHLASILENANWAPTHGMTEPWRFTIFTEDAREELGDLMQEIYLDITPGDGFRADKYEKLSRNPMAAPVVISIGMKRQESEKIPEVEEIEAVACAVQNMHLTASAIGMAAFWSSPAVCDTPAMLKFLELDPKRDRCLGLFYLGWPEESDEWPEGHRGEVSAKIVWRH